MEEDQIRFLPNGGKKFSSLFQILAETPENCVIFLENIYQKCHIFREMNGALTNDHKLLEELILNNGPPYIRVPHDIYTGSI